MELDLAILGAGAAGMMAAVAAGRLLQGTNQRIAIFERNSRPGIKVLVCGGGRCNFTNAGTVEFLIAQFGRNGRFLTPALRALDNEALRDFFARLDVPSHIEHDGKVYPDSNQARSVVDALVRRMRELGVEIFCGAGSAVATLDQSAGRFALTTADGRAFSARMVLLAVGGMSYQRMGTLGDGYRFARSLGHSVVTPRPAIVGLLVKEPWGKEIQGLAVRDVELTVIPPETAGGGNGRIKTVRSVHDVLFTHFGLSGPAVLNPSEIVAEMLESVPPGEGVELRIDFARHLSHAAAHDVLRRWQQHHGRRPLKKMFSQNVPELLIQSTSPDQTAIATSDEAAGKNPLALPARLAEKICTLEKIPPDQWCATLTTAQMHRLVERIKSCRFTCTGTRGFKEAMVTAGGVKLSEVNPDTMESKITPRLFLSGEVLDLTGPSGGYNLQLAFSTGHLAGSVIASRLDH